jgi:DNA-binding beta-propeller fold protein YncE
MLPKQVAAALLLAFAAFPSTAPAQTPTFVMQWGTQGHGPGQFEYPYGAAVSPNGDIYVTDQYNYRIQEFTPTGQFVRAWGGQGTAPGLFGLTIGITTDALGDVYVTDPNNQRIQVFTGDGSFIRMWTIGPGIYRGAGPRAVAVDALGNVYVGDDQDAAVLKYDNTGQYRGSFSASSLDPLDVAVDPSGEIFVANGDRKDILAFAPNGNVFAWGTEGLGDSQFQNATGLALDDRDNVFTVDCLSNHIQEFTGTGAFIARWNGPPSAPGQDQELVDVAVGPSGDIYVVDLLGNRIEKFSYLATPVLRRTWGSLKTAFR